MRKLGLSIAILAWKASAADAVPNPQLELHYNISNLGQPIANEWIVLLGTSSKDLSACGALCAAYDNTTRGPYLRRCQSFTRFAAEPSGPCYGHLDPVWLPLSGVNGSGQTVADSGIVLRPCEIDFDCSYNGVCSNGTCKCSQGWTGRRCQSLDLLPVDKNKYGFLPTDSDGANLSSWGGSILSHQGRWHMWAARMENYCGIGQWFQNSKIVHATASNVLGPYTEQDTVAEVFAHEPCVTRDPRTGELLMVSVNYPITGPFSNVSVFNGSGVCNCSATCTRRAVGSRNKCKANCSSSAQHSRGFLPIIRTAPGVHGPWSETLSPVLGHSDSNLACWLNGTGALRCNGRGGGLQAAADINWKNFSSWEDFKLNGDDLWVSSRPDDEDPMPWQDMETGVWHSIQHNLQGPHMCAGQLCQVGTHQFSLDGGRQWFYTGTAYTSLVQYTDGSSHLFDRRERPHMVFAENSTIPVALSNAVRPGGLDGDHTFTLVQGLRVQQGSSGVSGR